MRLLRTRHSFVRLLVIVAVGVLAVWFAYEGQRRADEDTNRPFDDADLRQIKTALDSYLATHDGIYPTRLEVVAQSGLIADGSVLAGVTFPAAGRRATELKPSDYVVVRRYHPWDERKEMTPPRFALRADGEIEYASQTSE